MCNEDPPGAVPPSKKKKATDVAFRRRQSVRQLFHGPAATLTPLRRLSVRLRRS